MNLNKFFFIILLIPLSFPLSVRAEYNAFKLGEASGSQIYAIHLIHAFKNSQCAYISIKEFPINPVISDIKQTLKAGDWEDFESFLDRNSMKIQESFYKTK